MKSKVYFFEGLWLVLFIFILAASAFAQSNNRDAVKWFNIGLRVRNDYEAIEAYKKSIALDAEFMEAMINAGLRYKKIGDFEQAEKYLEMALTAKTGKIAPDMKFKILYEIANIYLRKSEINAYERKVGEARAATQNQSLLATLAFEHGRFLYQQNRYREAILELQNGLRANPPNRNYFENLIGLAEKAQQLQNLYTRATTEESKGQLDSALVFFEQIYQSDPAFGNVEQKISQLRSRLVAENAKKSVAPLYEQATRYEKRGKFEAAIAVYESVLSKFPNDKIAQRKLEKARQNFLIRSRQRMLKSMYAAGMKALQKDDLTRAIVAFEEILALDANYKDTGQRLAAARKKIESKTTEAVVFRQYDDGMKAWNDGRYEQALSAFKKAQTIDPRYEDVAVKIAKVEQKLREQGNDISGIYLPKEIHAKKDSLFEIADAMVEKQKWHAALNAYEQIRTISPEDVIAIEQIAQLRAKLNVAASQTVQSGHDGFGKIILFAGGAVAFLIILPLVSAFTFAPTVRMRYFLMVGNLLRAANIIERLLDQNPGRLKLYPILANIYLLNQRRDAKAIKVYRTVARLNLARQNKQAIESMLAQYYMVESGETDQEALRILEDRLQDELRKRAKS